MATNTKYGIDALNANTTGINNTAIGAYASSDNTSGQSDVSLGINALLKNTSGDYNTALGTAAMCFNTTGSSNTAVGSNALENNISGSNNTALGTQALFDSTGGNNTAVGYKSMLKTTTSTNNTAVGFEALVNNTTGGDNTAIGHTALHSNTTGGFNTAVGYEALLSSVTNANNTAVGLQALELLTTGTDNTALGNSCNKSITSGSFTTAIGADTNTAGFNYSTVLGYASACTGDHQVVLGTTQENVIIPGSYVGINGVEDPSLGYSLDVSGNANVSGNLTNLNSLGFSSTQSALPPNFIINTFAYIWAGSIAPGATDSTNLLYYSSTNGLPAFLKHSFITPPNIFVNVSAVDSGFPSSELVNVNAHTIVVLPNNTFSIGIHNMSTVSTLTSVTVQVLVIGW